MALELKTVMTLTKELENPNTECDVEYLRELIRSDVSYHKIATELYQTALKNIRTHRPIRIELEKFETLLWVYSSNLNVRNLSWFQFGAPRLKAIADEFEFRWPDDERLVNMLKGKPCQEGCVGCTDYKKLPTYNWRRK